MKDTLEHAGYSHEDEYFYKLNKELIEKRRADLAKEKAAVHDTEKSKVHWMKCPKCGHQMNEIVLCGINIDKCSHCQGVYFDQGELDMLIEAKEPSSFLTRLAKSLV